MSRREINLTPQFLRQLAPLGPRLRERVRGYVEDLAAAEDPATVAEPYLSPAGEPVEHVWLMRRPDALVVCAVYDALLVVDALHVTPDT
ncbi:type II toxin-antitoxin system RelE family toxin [Nocardiopsis baichengensis]|uniref:type II toxin-antitoxin system RelE family toxin n=1 Tax=Nocardiopsis baichengensis TaxID=280240 RepID=UPI00034C9705|nr:hypothetical protein [Nocardiopsis baichengensis]